MAALQKLAHRQAFLSRPEVSTKAAGLAAIFAKAAAPFQTPGMIGEGILEGVECDLIYALLRHSLWTATPLFASVLIDHLATSYQLPRPVAESLARTLLPCVRQYIPEQSLPGEASDQAFLRYICIATATTCDESTLRLDLGLGCHLIARIKQALQQIFAEDEVDDGQDPRFLPELDALIAAVVYQLSQQLRCAPALLQQERLRYILATVSEPWMTFIRTHGIHWLFDLLLRVASHKTMSTRQIATQLRMAFPDEKGVLLDTSVTALCHELARHHLINLERGLNTWRALPLAEELTAEAFATQETASFAIDLAELSGLNASFQASVIRSLALSTAEVEDLILNLRPLTPLGLRAALGQLAELGPQASLQRTIKTLLAKEPSVWLRRVVSDMASLLGIAHDAVPVARSDSWPNDSIHLKPVSSDLD